MKRQQKLWILSLLMMLLSLGISFYSAKYALMPTIKYVAQHKIGTEDFNWKSLPILKFSLSMLGISLLSVIGSNAYRSILNSASQKKEIDRPSKFIRNWAIYDVSFQDERNFSLDIFSYKLRGVRHRSLAEKVTFNNYPEEEMPTIEVALDRRYKHTKNEAIAILTEKLAEQINKFETQWETCQNSTEKRETVQSFQGRDNPIVIAYKRSKKINFIPLFDIKWVDISWVKEDIYKSGSKHYYEIILSSKQMVKISSDEIWLATPSGQKLQKEKGIKSLWTMDEKGLSEYRQELHSAEILLSDLYYICQAYKHNQKLKLEHLSNTAYLIWITQELGYSINNDFYYGNKSLNSSLFKPCIPFLFCCGE